VCCWWGHFVSFFAWFAMAPLLGEMRDTLGLQKTEIWMSAVVGVRGTMVSRVLLGLLCDRFGGPRLWMMIILVFTGIFTGMTGLVQNYQGLATLRFFIGFAGGICHVRLFFPVSSVSLRTM